MATFKLQKKTMQTIRFRMVKFSTSTWQIKSSFPVQYIQQTLFTAFSNWISDRKQITFLKLHWLKICPLFRNGSSQNIQRLYEICMISMGYVYDELQFKPFRPWFSHSFDKTPFSIDDFLFENKSISQEIETFDWKMLRC